MSLLLRAVRDRCRQNLQVALDLLGIHRGLDRMRSVHSALEKRAEAHDALELLDVALAGDPMRPALLSLLERRAERRKTGAGRAQVRRLCRSRDPLLRGIARHTLVFKLEDTLAGSIEGSGLSAIEIEGEDMPASLVERLFLLEHVDLFEGLPTDDVAAIAAIASELTLPMGALLYREGENGTQLYVIIEGMVELTRGGKPLMTLATGESAGQVSFLDQGPRPVTATASRPSRLLVVEREAFMDLLADRPGLMHAFFGVLAARLRTLIEREASAKPELRRRAPTSV